MKGLGAASAWTDEGHCSAVESLGAGPSPEAPLTWATSTTMLMCTYLCNFSSELLLHWKIRSWEIEAHNCSAVGKHHSHFAERGSILKRQNLNSDPRGGILSPVPHDSHLTFFSVDLATCLRDLHFSCHRSIGLSNYVLSFTALVIKCPVSAMASLSYMF